MKQSRDMIKAKILLELICRLKVQRKVVDVNIKVRAKLVEKAVVKVVRLFPQVVFLWFIRRTVFSAVAFQLRRVRRRAFRHGPSGIDTVQKGFVFVWRLLRHVTLWRSIVTRKELEEKRIGDIIF